MEMSEGDWGRVGWERGRWVGEGWVGVGYFYFSNRIRVLRA